MDQRLNGSYSGIDTFMRNNQKFGDKAAVEKELEKLDTYSLHRKVTSKFKRRRTLFRFANEILACDLKDVANISKQNNSIKFLLICVDAFTKKAYVRPLRNKKSDTMIEALNDVFKEIGEPPIYLFTDRGLEFKATKVTDFLTSKGVHPYHVYSKIKASFAENFIGKLFQRIQRFLTHRGNNRYIDHLQEFVDSYNNTISSVTGKAPNAIGPRDTYDVWERIFKKYLEERKKKRQAPKFHIGQIVRISREKVMFRKGRNQ